MIITSANFSSNFDLFDVLDTWIQKIKDFLNQTLKGLEASNKEEHLKENEHAINP